MKKKKIIYYDPMETCSHDYAEFSRNIRLICWLKCCVPCSHHLSVDDPFNVLIFLVRSFLSYRLRNNTIEDCNIWQEGNIKQLTVLRGIPLQKRKLIFVQHVWKINYAIGWNNSKIITPNQWYHHCLFWFTSLIRINANE